MDHIYPTKDYNVYKIKDEHEKLRNSVEINGAGLSLSEISTLAGCSEVKTREIALGIVSAFEDYGSELPLPDQLTPFDKFTSESMELNSTKLLMEGGLTFKDLRYKEYETKPKQPYQMPESIEYQIPQFSEVVITLRFYEPFKYTPSIKNQPRFHMEYQVLGSNFLTDLRDKFFCVSNFGPFFDISDDPLGEREQLITADPGFLFIFDTFYNDMRNKLNIDYSECILKWYKKMSYVRKFKSERMETTKFEDLHVRFGYPCVYQHQGSCEHIFCVTSIDLIDSTFDLDRRNYPKLMRCAAKHTNLCDLCNQVETSYQVSNCELHVRDPVNVCDTCFFSFHYNRDRTQKVCEFQAYRIYSSRPDAFDHSEVAATVTEENFELEVQNNKNEM